MMDGRQLDRETSRYGIGASETAQHAFSISERVSNGLRFCHFLILIHLFRAAIAYSQFQHSDACAAHAGDCQQVDDVYHDTLLITCPVV